MQDYKPNSHRFKEEQKAAEEKKKVEKVVTSSVRVKKKGTANKLASLFISDKVGDIKSFVVDEVIIPTIKDTIWSIFTNSLDMTLYGGRSHGTSRSRSGSPNVSYRAYYDQGRTTRHSNEVPRSSSRFDYDDLIFTTRGDAEAVLEQMCNIIDEYDIVTVSAMYDAADVTAPYTSENFGWNNLRTAKVVRIRDGYIIELPKARPINQL